jgi:hypothetical protein
MPRGWSCGAAITRTKVRALFATCVAVRAFADNHLR